jgi:ferredoxin
VTTDLPLVPDRRSDDTSMVDFCRNCSKCADCCPIHAIPEGDRQEFDGALRWRLNADMCFRYWNATGTDCGRCMAVCPYSRPDNLAHNAVRWVVVRSGAGRRAVAWLDDVFYGTAPKSKPFPAWIPPPPSRR